MAKRVRISVDGGTTYYTLPGNTGDMRREMSQVNDTIFGQDYSSEDVSIGTWTVTANGIYKGVAGYLAKIMEGGAPVALTAEATTLVSGKTYQITAVSNRTLSYSTPITVSDNGADQTANVENIDYLNGTVTFKDAYTPTGPITITGASIPMSQLAKGKSFGLTQTAAEIDETVYENAQANGGWRVLAPGLKNVSMEVGGLFDLAEDMQAALVARALMYVEVQPDGSPDSVFRGFFKRTNLGQSGDVGALEDQSLGLSLFVPDGELVSAPFNWYFTNASGLNPGIRALLGAWQAGNLIKVQYLPNGTDGYEGDAMIAECSIANTFEGLNEFRFTFRGSGTPAKINL